MSARLPVHLEVSGIIRAAETAGGFAAVLARGERDAGTLLLVCCARGQNSIAYERLPRPDGKRTWQVARIEDDETPESFEDYLAKRRKYDSDLWIVELDVPDAARFIDSVGTVD